MRMDSMSELQNSGLVSLIIPVRNEGNNIKKTLDSAFHVKTECQFEVVVIDDGSTDGCCQFLLTDPRKEKIYFHRTRHVGLAKAKNLGAQFARGDFFIFCDAHLTFEDYWIERLIEPIRQGVADAANPGIADSRFPDRVGYGTRWTNRLEIKWNTKKETAFETPLLAGGCLAISRKAFFDIDGFDRGFQVWGKEDEEIALKLWLFGYKCYAVPDVKICHLFRSTFPYGKVTHDHVNYNFLRMAYSHFNENRIRKCKQLIKHSNPAVIESLVLRSDVLSQRRRYFSRRKYDDNWYMEKFSIPF